MAGELWRQTVQVGKETVYGTPVAATRRLYCREPRLTRERDARAHRFATATRDNVRNITLGPTRVGGTLAMPVSAEILELLLMGLQGGVTGAGAGEAKTWTFLAGANALDSATIEWDDGARAWQAAGCYVDSLRFTGNVREENILTAELFGKSMQLNPLTPALAQRVPPVFEGWEAALYIDDLGDTPGTTPVPGTLINWDVSIQNGLRRKYYADNTLDLSAAVLSELTVEATLTFEASAAAAATEFANWEAQTQRLIRLEFGNNQVIGAGPDTERVCVDIAGGWTAVDLAGEDEGTRTYQLTFQGIHDLTNAFTLQVEVRTARATAWS